MAKNYLCAMLKNTPLRLKIALSFVVISLFGFIFIINYIILHEKEIDLTNYRGSIQETRALVYKSLQLQNEFLYNDSRTNQFHISGTSANAENFEKNSQALITQTITAENNYLSREFGLSSELIKLRAYVTAHQRQFMIVQSKLLEKGYFNFGLEGELRLYIHQLEKEFTFIIPLEVILQLRRHEKDYMLRHDLNYAERHEKLIDSLTVNLITKDPRTDIAKLILKNYNKAFQSYVKIDSIIGYDKFHGMRNILYTNSNNLLNQLDLIIQKSELMSKNYTRRINKIFLVFGISFLIILLIIIYTTARILTKPILKLSKNINSFISSNYESKSTMGNETRRDEIGDLIRNFNALQIEIADHFTNFRIKATSKQKKLEEQKEKIKIQKFLVLESRNLLREQNNSYAASINYAQRIQNSILPTKIQLNHVFQDIGLIYSPKSIVSGDCYWVYENESYKFAAVVDCTGHGVPGAFMSILGMTYLNYSVKDKGLISTADILDYLNNNVAEVLGQIGVNSTIKDGMDIALIRICKKTNELEYSGAQRELLIIKDEQLINLSPDKFPIGWILPGEKKRFSSQKIQLDSNETILMYSDGVTDQFGGFANKKFTRKRLYELIGESKTKTASELADLISKELKIWKGTLDQTDDICLISLKYSIQMTN